MARALDDLHEIEMIKVPMSVMVNVNSLAILVNKLIHNQNEIINWIESKKDQLL